MKHKIVNKHFIFILKLLFFVVPLALVIRDVIEQKVSIISLLSWITYLIFLVLLLFPKIERVKLSISKHTAIHTLLLSIIGIIILTFFSLNKYHFHYDEHITAYTSYTLPSIFNLNWFGVVPEVNDWVSQFPMLYHVFQKPFLILNPSLLMVRISTFPYTIGIILILYFLLKEMVSRQKAVIGVLLFIFFAPQMYLGSLGLHFHSSTFFFILSFYFFIKLWKYKKNYFSIGLGISMAASYMTYTSSYITFPLIFLFMLISLIKGRGTGKLMLYLKSIILFVATLFPLLIFASSVNNFFIQRVNQVNIINGSWKNPDESFNTFSSFLDLLYKQTSGGILALYKDGFSGAGEYWFGKESFFEPIGLLLFILGTFFLISIIIKKSHLTNLFILISFVISFIASFILTLHPVPFHRLSIVYPIIGIMMLFGILLLEEIVKNLFKKEKLALSCSTIILIIFIISNLLHTEQMIIKDKALKSDDIIKVSDYLTHEIKKGSNIYIAAFPSNAFGKELLFRTNNSYVIKTNYLEYLSIDKDDSIIILHLPNEESSKEIKNKYPNAKKIDSLILNNYAVYKN